MSYNLTNSLKRSFRGFVVVVLLMSVSNVARCDDNPEFLLSLRPPVLVASGLGQVSFPISCRSSQTQRYFNQGVALIHANDPVEAQRSFYHAYRLEPDCAMVWWGLAVANLDQSLLAAKYLDRALQRISAGSGRERRWIEALVVYTSNRHDESARRQNYLRDLDRIATDFPEDHEASVFLVRQFLENRGAGLPIPFQAGVDALIERIERASPEHPIACYRLQLWEHQQPQRALAGAERIRQTMAASVPALMTAGRLYSRLGRMDDALDCFKTAATVCHQRMIQDQVWLGEVTGGVQNQRELSLHLLRMGRVPEGINLARGLIEMTVIEIRRSDLNVLNGNDVPNVNTNPAMKHRANSLDRAGSTSTVIGQQLLLGELIRLGCWEMMRGFDQAKFFASTHPEISALSTYARGLAHYAKQESAGLAQQQSALIAMGTRLPETEMSDAAARRVHLQIKESLQNLDLCQQILGGEVSVEQTIPEWLRQMTANNSCRQEGLSPQQGEVRFGSTRFEILAPPFSLPDRYGKPISAVQADGHSTLIVFFLGAGCPHCIQQLQSLLPLKQEFQDAKINVVAVSTDSVAGLQQTFRVAGADEAIPFPLCSDQDLNVFRKYGSFDSFTQKPLHGIFLVDPQGKIVWQNISLEPFMETRSLLNEAKRVMELREAAMIGLRETIVP